MKFNRISRAVAGLCAVAAAPVFALPASNYTNSSEFVGDTMNIRTSGATAVDPGFIASALRACVPGTITRYSRSSNAVVFCTINTTVLTPRTGATKLAFYKYSIGGSGGGVGNVNNATAIPMLDLTKVNSTGYCGVNTTVNSANFTAVQDVDGTNPLPPFSDVLCSAGSLTTNAVSYIGVSDVEPNFFGIASGNYNNLLAEPLATVIFGVPVTRNIFEALQLAQSKIVGNLTEPEMPTLSQAQITSMYTQEGQSWNKLTGATVGDDVVYVARRASTSGTQKTFEALIARTANSTAGGRECQSGVDPFLSGAAALDNTAATNACNGANTIVNNNGSNQVLVCMNAHQSGNRGAIGTLSTEFKVASAGSIRFVKINGIAPTYAGVASGQYTQYGDISLNTRIGVTLPTASALGYPAYLTFVKSSFANPATIEVVNGSNQPFGPSGLVALDQLVTPTVPPADYTGATARNPWSRVTSGVLNNCQPGKAAAF